MGGATWRSVAAIARPAAALVLISAMTLAGCAGSGTGLHPAALAIQELLELRAADVRDAEAYAPYFTESSLATALAEGSDVPPGSRRVPEWETPYVSEATTDTAAVVVVWRASDDFPDWPIANIFMLNLVGERWVVTDAQEATSVPGPVGTDSP